MRYKNVKIVALLVNQKCVRLDNYWLALIIYLQTIFSTFLSFHVNGIQSGAAYNDPISHIALWKR